MIKVDSTLEKLSTIEKAVDEMRTLRAWLLELKESENKRQKAFDELRASEDRYRILCENLPQQIFMKDKNSVYTFCSQRYAAELKRKPDEMIGRMDEDLYPKETAEKHRLGDKRIMTTGQPEDMEEYLVREGQAFVVRNVKTPLKDEKGEIVGILGVCWDITEQRRKEEKLKKKCEELEESLAKFTAEIRSEQTHIKLAEEEVRLSLEPFRRLVYSLDKYFPASNEKSQECRRSELNQHGGGLLLFVEEGKDGMPIEDSDIFKMGQAMSRVERG